MTRALIGVALLVGLARPALAQQFWIDVATMVSPQP